MNEHDGPLYEVTLNIDRDDAHDLDEWLESHVERMLDVPGIVAARSYALEDQDERVRRVTCYHFESDAHLENYLAEQASELRQHTVDRFGDRFTASRRVLRTAGTEPGNRIPIQHCLNCQAVLAGQYCGKCGQRSSSRLISIWELVRDAFGDLFELDSRLWQTLIPLAIRPGRLTHAYLQGRRARFMPPFRMYIVLSLVFFVVAFFDPRESLGLLFEPESAADTPPSEATSELSDEIRRDLATEGIVVEPEDEDGGLRVTIDGETVDEECNLDNYDASQMPGWMARRLTKQRLQLACERVFTEGDEGLRGFFDKLIENVPIGLFILLPVMALVLKVLYPLSRRYYVEHLLFVVHYHAFIFLALSVQILFSRATSAVGLPSLLSDVTSFVISVYIPVYLYKALRRVYGQGRLMTIAKLILLLFSYSVGLALILVFSALFAAFSV